MRFLPISLLLLLWNPAHVLSTTTEVPQSIYCAPKLSGAPYSDSPEEYAIYVWKSEGHTVHTHCVDVLFGTVWLGRDDLSGVCQPNSAACTKMEDGIGFVWYKNTNVGRSFVVHAHEMLHILMQCEGEPSWLNHNHHAWTYMPQSNLPKDSPWKIKEKKVKKTGK